MKEDRNPVMKNNTKSRIAVYDWVRLFATIWVVIGHSAYLDDAGEHGSVVFALPELLSPAYNDLPLRFIRFLSGWGHQPRKFLIRKLQSRKLRLPRLRR